MKKIITTTLLIISLNCFSQPSSKKSTPTKDPEPTLITDTVKVFIGTLDNEGYLKYSKGFVIRKSFTYSGQILAVKEAILYDEKWGRVINAFDTKQRQ